MKFFCLKSRVVPLVVWLLFGAAAQCAADDPTTGAPEEQREKNWLRRPTFGGRNWRECCQVSGYRLQQHNITGRYRLLDAANVRVAAGSLERCEEALARELAGGAERQNVNLPLATLGGKQFWGDVAIYSGWRIQQSALTGHFRLLDASDVRRAWGNEQQCRRALQRAIADGRAAPPRSRRLVILLHGILGAKETFAALQHALEAQGYEVCAVNYPSTRFTLESHSAQIERLLRELEADFDEINFVTHSMGGLIARRVLSQPGRSKVRRLVMLTPPNQGAQLADLCADWLPVKLIWGYPAQQLKTDVESFARNCGIPRCEFGVIAGASPKIKSLERLLPGADDWVVEVSSTPLEGMRDYLLIEGGHLSIVDNQQAIDQTLHFLRHGQFRH